MEEVVEGIKELLNNPEVFKEFSQERFDHCDKDKSGLIDKAELEKALKEIAEEMKAPKTHSRVCGKDFSKV